MNLHTVRDDYRLADPFAGSAEPIAPRELDSAELAVIATLHEVIDRVRGIRAQLIEMLTANKSWILDDAPDAAHEADDASEDLDGMVERLLEAVEDVRQIPAREAERAEDARRCGELV